MGSSSSSMKALLISTAVASLAAAIKLAIPSLLSFAGNSLPAIYSHLIPWMKPPYLYFVINGIIVAIAVTSWFQPQQPEGSNPPNAPEPVELPPVAGFEPPAVAAYETEVSPVVDVEVVPEVKREEEDGFLVSRSTWEPRELVVECPPLPENVPSESGFPVTEKPPVTSRFANHRRPTKTSPEGVSALRVLKPRKHETLESTWKAITDGRRPPLTRHLRKSDTFENHLHRRDSSGEHAAEMRKSETFRDRTSFEDENHRPPSRNLSPEPATGVRLRKDGSPSHDELNRRVEAFIKKFNDEMRLQRQESLNQYMEMINRGAH